MRSILRHSLGIVIVMAFVFLLASLGAMPAIAADHDDTPALKAIPRHEARLSDLHVFTREGRLVLSLCTNPAIPGSVAQYQFPEDLTLRIHVDHHSEISFDDPAAVATYGGSIVDPAHVGPDVTFEITFGRDGRPRLRTEGIKGQARHEMRMFTGLRDDPFVRGPRIGRNVASVVIDVPLDAVLGSSSAILVWATSRVPDVHGPISEHAGRALRSQFAESLALNELRPREHYTLLGLRPDVIIYDTSLPAVFPNGRELGDDVVNAVGDSRVLGTDSPFPSANDVPFLAGFPYLAPPH